MGLPEIPIMPRVLSQSNWNQSRPPSIWGRKGKIKNKKNDATTKIQDSLCRAYLELGCEYVNLEHGTRVDTREHNHSSSLKCSDPQAEPHLPTLAALCHSVLDVTVSREAQGGLTYKVTKKYEIHESNTRGKALIHGGKDTEFMESTCLPRSDTPKHKEGLNHTCTLVESLRLTLADRWRCRTRTDTLHVWWTGLTLTKLHRSGACPSCWTRNNYKNIRK